MFIYFHFSHFFALNLLVGMMMTSILKKLGLAYIIDRSSIDRISGLCLDALLVAAIATTDMAGALDSIVPLTAMVVCGFGFNLILTFVVAPKFFVDYPYQRGFFEFGCCSGTTPIGLLLMQMVDPETPPSVHRAISIKLMIDCPLIGIYMAVGIVVLINLGAESLFVLSCCLLIFWIALWYTCFRPSKFAAVLQTTKAGLADDASSFVSIVGRTSHEVTEERMSQHGLVRVGNLEAGGLTERRSGQSVEMGSLDS